MPDRPRALDLFCCAGGATKGLQRAGFHVTGVDIKPQARYCGDAFIQADALEVPLEGFDFIWASPPCHGYSNGTVWRRNQGVEYPMLIDATRDRLIAWGDSWCMENVAGAKRALKEPFMLCGSMFGLGIARHRLFESPIFMLVPPHDCDRTLDRDLVTVTKHGPPARWYKKNPGRKFNIKTWHDAMGIDWMARDQLTQAIPPAYSEFIGSQAIQHILVNS